MLALSTKHRIDAATAMLPRRVRYTIGPSSLHPLCLPSGLPGTDGWLGPQTKRSGIVSRQPPATQTNGAFSWLSIVLWLSCWGAVLVTQEFIQCAAGSFRCERFVTLTAPCVVLAGDRQGNFEGRQRRRGNCTV